MNPRCAIQCVLTCLNKMLFNLDSLCWCLILFRLKMLQCDTWILHSPTYSLDLPLKVISFCQDHFSHAQEWESMMFSILMEQNVFHKKDLVLPKAMKMYIEECDSKSLCSPCAMLYQYYTKDSLWTRLLPPLAHIENNQRCCAALHNYSMRK